MLALGSFSAGGKRWFVTPLIAIRAALVSTLSVVAALLILDHFLMAALERRGMIGGGYWENHNRLVSKEHEATDRTENYPLVIRHPIGGDFAYFGGVRAWCGQEVNKAKAKTRRILVMGDSYVAGASYLTRNHQWWRQLADELKWRGYEEVEVIAAGNAGLSTGEELELARQVVADYHPDLVLWGYVTNDPDERVVELPVANTPFPGRAWLQAFLPHLSRELERHRSEKVARSAEAAHFSYPEWELTLLEGENFRRYHDTVARVGEFHRATGIPALMVTLPNFPSREYFAERYRPVLPLWQDAGIPAYDLLPSFLNRYPEVSSRGASTLAWGINPADSHPGPRACRFFAVQAADILARDFATQLGTPHPNPTARAIAVNDWLPAELNVQPIPGAAAAYRLEYPADDSQLVTVDLDTPTGLVAMASPARLKEICLRGDGLVRARLWFSGLDPAERYDDGQWLSQGELEGPECRWRLAPAALRREVAVIRFQAVFTGGNRSATLELVPADSAGVAAP